MSKTFLTGAQVTRLQDFIGVIKPAFVVGRQSPLQNGVFLVHINDCQVFVIEMPRLNDDYDYRQPEKKNKKDQKYEWTALFYPATHER